MRTHTTKTLKDLVLDKLDPQKYQMSDHECEVWQQSLLEIEGEMLETMYFFNCHLFNRSMTCRQLRQIHKECIYLLDKIYKIGMLAGKMEQLRLALIACLDAIVEKLLTDYAKFIEFDHLMPVIHLRREQERIGLGITALKAMFDGLDVPSKMQTEIFFCMKEVIKGQRCLYTRMIYVRSLLEALPEICRTSAKSRICDDLIHFLIERNYNTEEFVKFYIKFVRDGLAEIVEDAEKKRYLDGLDWRLRSRTYRKSVYRYDDTRTHVKQVLHDFVCAELAAVQERICARERIAQDAYRASQIPAAVRPTETTAVYKIRTIFSVESLAYFLKLMIEAKVIEAGVKTELFACIASLFETPGTAENGISVGSLGTKYKNVVQATAIIVRPKLVRMIRIIDEEFELAGKGGEA